MTSAGFEHHFHAVKETTNNTLEAIQEIPAESNAVVEALSEDMVFRVATGLMETEIDWMYQWISYWAYGINQSTSEMEEDIIGGDIWRCD